MRPVLVPILLALLAPVSFGGFAPIDCPGCEKETPSGTYDDDFCGSYYVKVEVIATKGKCALIEGTTTCAEDTPCKVVVKNQWLLPTGTQVDLCNTYGEPPRPHCVVPTPTATGGADQPAPWNGFQACSGKEHVYSTGADPSGSCPYLKASVRATCTQCVN